MTSGKCLFSISGSTVVPARVSLKLNFTHFHREGDFALRSSRQGFTIALAAWYVLYFGSLGYGFPASSRLVAAGEVASGVHGISRLEGNSLLDCVTDSMSCTESGTDY